MPISTLAASIPDLSPLRTRLSRLASLEASDLNVLRAAERDQRRWPARREMMAEGDPVRGARAVLSGWACRQRILSDGRRQIVGFLLPGDLIGMCGQRDPVASTSILAVTEVVTCPVPDAGADEGGLSEAYALSAALDEHHHIAQITRLGRLNAQERLADWFLEAWERLALAGLATGNQFTVPLTQELLADALGLTSVHVNRTLQGLRHDGLLNSRGGMISFPDRSRLESLVDHRTARVTAGTHFAASSATGK